MILLHTGVVYCQALHVYTAKIYTGIANQRMPSGVSFV